MDADYFRKIQISVV